MKKLWIVIITLMLISACSRQGSEEPASVEESSEIALEISRSVQNISTDLYDMAEDYFEEFLKLNPVIASFYGDNRYNDQLAIKISPEHRRQSMALYKTYLGKLTKLDSANFDEQDWLTYRVFKTELEQRVEGHQYPSHLLPVGRQFSFPNIFALIGSGAGFHPFDSKTDYEKFLSRIDGFSVWVDQAIANMDEGRREGVVQPRVVMEKVLEQLSSHVVDSPDQSVFYRPLENVPEVMSDSDLEQLSDTYKAAIMQKVVPAYRKLRDYIRDTYLPDTRDSIGLGELPGGPEWYSYRVRIETTTSLTPEEIHQIGLSEVSRIRDEMEKVKDQLDYAGSLDTFFEFMKTDSQFYFEEPEQLLNAYRSLRTQVEAAALDLLSSYPKTKLEIRPVEEFEEGSSGVAFYFMGPPDGSRPAVFYVNTSDVRSRPKYDIEWIFLHEAIPGHHYQMSLANELEGVPRVRRFSENNAYIEGWGLYAESLGMELGFYQDPYSYFGALSGEMLRAVRLVVDTGMHAKGWSRKQAIDYMRENYPASEIEITSEIDRYIVLPGQALSYKIGQLKIGELRNRAEKTLGKNFDIREFHAVILEDGALPLNVLEEKVVSWMEQEKSPPQT